jgi:hypothetical protein
VSYQRVKGEDAEAILRDTHKLTEDQARRMLGTARDLGRVNFPVKGGYDVLGVKYAAGWYFIGPPDFTSTKRGNH